MTNGILDILPSSWRVCLRRSKSNGKDLCLDLSNRSSNFGAKLDSHQLQPDDVNNNYVSLSREIWNADRKELKLGLEWLQLSIFQPLIQNKKPFSENNSLSRSSDNGYRSYSMNVTLRDVLICRYVLFDSF